mmetsp:Transcript_13739/g.39189  ORF Transcript_13739/g.39189 Transcript_13739/m.39189 type:complete len:89 (-) Transcript_13739:516-782(-)
MTTKIESCFSKCWVSYIFVYLHIYIHQMWQSNSTVIEPNNAPVSILAWEFAALPDDGDGDGVSPKPEFRCADATGISVGHAESAAAGD